MSYFPIKIILMTEQRTIIVMTADELPLGVPIKIIETNVSLIHKFNDFNYTVLCNPDINILITNDGGNVHWDYVNCPHCLAKKKPKELA